MKMKSPHENAVESILYGHRCAMRLKQQLDDPVAENGSVSSYDLATSIVDCFSNAISILSDKPKSEDDQLSDLSSRDSSPPPPPQRGHSKKRKLNSSNSSENWRDDSPNPTYYDGFLWRKYGQKTIKKSDHQRSYYKCSYNKDHHCEARKYEQKIKDNPPVYRTTYFGYHTCQINHNQDPIFTDVQERVDDLESAGMIRFGKDLDKEKECHTRGFTVSVKHEKDFIKNELAVDPYREVIGDDQDCEHVMEENQSSPSGSYPLTSSSGSESIGFDSDLLLDNLDSWDSFDQFDFGLR